MITFEQFEAAGRLVAADLCPSSSISFDLWLSSEEPEVWVFHVNHEDGASDSLAVEKPPRSMPDFSDPIGAAADQMRAALDRALKRRAAKAS